MYRVQAWNAMGGKLDYPSPPMELKQALSLALEYRNRGLHRITLIDAKTGEEITDLEHFMLRELPRAHVTTPPRQVTFPPTTMRNGSLGGSGGSPPVSTIGQRST